MPGATYDLAIIGGGINGAGIAADAAGRGLKVVLFEKGDLAGGTSSASSKLIHGGLRYLEQREFRLVRHALAEREVLLDRAAHLIHPLRFIIPHTAGMRPRFVMRAGLFLYDGLARRRRIPASASVDLTRDPMGRALRADFRSGFSYYDCWVDDARLVAIVALDAAERGAHIHTGTPVIRFAREGEGWRIDAEAEGARRSFSARAVVNAAGPWCAQVAALSGPDGAAPLLRLVRGTHIVVPRIPGANDAFLLQNADGRVVFALPFGARFTMIGTTEVAVSNPADGFVASAEEEAYLIDAANRYLAHPLTRTDIVWRFTGVRPLVDDGAATTSSITRDWRLDLVQPSGSPPLLNVIGGKITTFRLLAEAALDRLRPHFRGMGGAWTAHAPLPGGDGGPEGIAGYRADLARQRPGVSTETLDRLVALYGTRADRILGDAVRDADLGPALGGGLSEREVCYLRDHEWARTADDVLWRRTKAGLDLNDAQRTQAEAAISRLLARA